MEEVEILYFGAKMVEVAEKELKVNFVDDEGGALQDNLWAGYKQAGKPKLVKPWIRRELTELFRCVDKWPEWVERDATWPFLAGSPMVFIRQWEVPATEVSKELLYPGATLYLFGKKVGTPERWEIQYKVVSQLRELSGVTLSVHGMEQIEELNKLAG